MRNKFIKSVGRAAVLVLLMLTALTQISVFAQDTLTKVEQTPEDIIAGRNNARRLEGVWNIQVTARNCQTGAAIRTFPSMFTFMSGGTMSEWGSGNAPSTRGSGHGVWSHLFDYNYTSAFQFFRFNADGTHAGKQIVRQQIELTFDNSFTSSATAQIFDGNGNVTAINCSTAVGTRFE